MQFAHNFYSYLNIQKILRLNNFIPHWVDQEIKRGFYIEINIKINHMICTREFSNSENDKRYTIYVSRLNDFSIFH